MGKWIPAPASVPGRWHLERERPGAEPELATTPGGSVRLFASPERAAMGAAWLNGEPSK